MSSDRDDGRRHGGGAGGTAGQGEQPLPGRDGADRGDDSRLQELRARMRAIESGAKSAEEFRARSSGGLGTEDAADGARPEQSSDSGDSSGSAMPRCPPRSSNLLDPGSERPIENAIEDVRFSADPADASLPDPDALSFDESLTASPRRGRKRTPREQTPTQRALGLLTRREHSRKELTRKLTSRGLDREEVVAAVDRLADAGWQNDVRFAESLIRSRAGNGYGPVHIRAELGVHGLGGQIIAEALQNYEGDWLGNARDLARRRFGDEYFRDPALRRKAADLLIRRGFDGETVRSASRSCAED